MIKNLCIDFEIDFDSLSGDTKDIIISFKNCIGSAGNGIFMVKNKMVEFVIVFTLAF